MVVQVVVVKNLVMMLDLGQSRVVLGEWMKNINRQRNQSDLCCCVCCNTTAHV